VDVVDARRQILFVDGVARFDRPQFFLVALEREGFPVRIISWRRGRGNE
jgi:hypothetical protein